jgi:glycosyltransferase involved in cell wall biosynthesis
MAAHGPLVTIAIPTYNRAAFSLPQAIRAALAQTYPHLEILVSDNCSSDDTEAVVRGFNDPRLRYVRQAENIGANANFNFCIEEAKGAFFLLFHDDDFIDPDLVETLITAARGDESAGLLRTGTRLIDAGGRVIDEYPNRAAGRSLTATIFGWFAGETSFYLCSTLFNTRVLREVGGLRSRHNLFQDVGAAMRVAARSGRVDVLPAKACFRTHTNVLYPEPKVMQWCEDSRDLLDLLCELVPAADRPRVRDEGTRYFCHKMYLYASRLSSRRARLRTYRRIFAFFGYVYSPLQFFLRRTVRPRLRAVRRRLTLVAAES